MNWKIAYVTPHQVANGQQLRAELEEELAPLTLVFDLGRDLTPEEEARESQLIDSISTVDGWIRNPRSGYLFS